MKGLEGFKNLLSFHTILPVGMGYEDLGEVARSAWLLPLLGFLMGLAAGGVGQVLSFFFSPGISSALALFLLLYLSGFHDLDGLLDFGDALMLRGPPEERVKAMRDVSIGVGGFAAGFFVLLLTFVALTEADPLLFALAAAETSAHYAVLPMAYFGRSSHEGMGSAYIRVLSKNHRAILLSTLLAFLLLVIVLPGKAVPLLGVTVFLSLTMTVLAHRTVGGVSGDVFGAAHEVARMGALVVILL
jgi:adenosylcobinamide-GDP ribazoletransferase